jgi:hypothetical protein
LEEKYIGMTIDSRTKDLIKMVAKQLGLTTSDLLRHLIKRELARLGYLTNDERKAFGLSDSGHSEHSADVNVERDAMTRNGGIA